jgi:hypothetical protein
MNWIFSLLENMPRPRRTQARQLFFPFPSLSLLPPIPIRWALARQNTVSREKIKIELGPDPGVMQPALSDGATGLSEKNSLLEIRHCIFREKSEMEQQ